MVDLCELKHPGSSLIDFGTSTIEEFSWLFVLRGPTFQTDCSYCKRTKISITILVPSGPCLWCLKLGTTLMYLPSCDQGYIFVLGSHQGYYLQEWACTETN